MPWCPKCKNEYRQGIKVCSDCKCDLVDTLSNNSQVPLTFGGMSELASLQEYLEYNKIENTNIRLDKKEGVYELLIDEKDMSAAKTLARVFMEQQMLQKQQMQMMAEQQAMARRATKAEKASIASEETEEETASASDGKKEVDAVYKGGFEFGSFAEMPVSTAQKAVAKKDGEDEKTEDNNQSGQDAEQNVRVPIKVKHSSGRYVDSADQAEDNKTSAWTLLIVGGIGLIVMVLGIAGVLPFNVGNPYMFYGVMGAVFLIFIIMSGVSLKNAKYYEQRAESENNLKDTILQWCEENLTAEKVDAQFRGASEVGEEEMYFRRYEMIKYMINRQFMNLDQGLLEKMIDDTVYDMVFSSDED